MTYSKPRPTYCLFTDGSGDPSSRRCGWGFILQSHEGEIEGCGSDRNLKTNRAELLAVIKGLEELPEESCTVIIFTDSLYVMHNRTRNGGELWEQFQVYRERHDIHFVKVGSKNQHPVHKRAHHLAREAVFNGRILSRKDITC